MLILDWMLLWCMQGRGHCTSEGQGGQKRVGIRDASERMVGHIAHTLIGITLRALLTIDCYRLSPQPPLARPRCASSTSAIGLYV